MAKVWKEPLDPARHLDHFSVGSAVPRQRGFGPEFSYFVRVAGFTFEFASLAQIREAIEQFSTTLEPSSRRPVFEPEKGHWQRWFDRLPPFIRKASRRARVIAALERALVELAD